MACRDATLRTLGVAMAIVGLVASTLLAGLAPGSVLGSPGPDRNLSSSSPSAGGGPGSVAVPPEALAAVVTLLAGYNVTTGGWGESFVVNFTVPGGTSHELYVWSLGGGLASYQLPQLPTGMTVATSVEGGAAGMAIGALAPGNYSTDLYFAGWTNAVSIAVYGVSNDVGYGYHFDGANQSTSLTLPSGAVEYLGLEVTGGTYPVNGTSLTTVDEETAALMGGETELIGRQTSDAFSFTTVAGGFGIAAVGIYPGYQSINFSETTLPIGTFWSVTLNGSTATTDASSVSFSVSNGTFSFTVTANCFVATPAHGSISVDGGGANQSVTFVPIACLPSVAVLAGYNMTTGGWGESFVVNFTVPGGTSHELYVWSLGGGLASYQLPQLPTGMAVATSVEGGAAGMAIGALAPGNYSTDLYFAGWTNAVSIAVYGVSNDVGYGYHFDGANQSTSLTLPSGAVEYLGLEVTGGTYPVNGTSLTTVDEETAALMGGETELIGRQTSDAFSFTTVAGGFGIAAVGIYPGYSTTFNESGLAPGAPWSVTLNGSTESGNASALAFTVPNGTYSYGVSAPCYVATPSDGSLTVAGSARYVNVTFLPTACTTVTFNEVGLPLDALWTVTIGTTTLGSNGPTVVFFLGSGTYGYSIEGLSGYTPTPSIGGIVVGTAAVMVNVTFSTTTYSLTIAETGLPAGGSWTAALDGQAETTSLPQLTLSVPKGTYEMLLSGPKGYRAPLSVDSRWIAVSGAGEEQEVRFEKGPASALKFHETGLARGTNWCVDVVYPICSSLATIVFKGLAAGPYTYSVAPVAGYRGTVREGTAAAQLAGDVDLARPALVFQVTFAPDVYPVTLEAFGLPAGDTWHVVATCVRSSNCHGMTARAGGEADALTLMLRNGTYTWRVSPIKGLLLEVNDVTGWSGSLTVEGAVTVETLTFSSGPLPPDPFV